MTQRINLDLAPSNIMQTSEWMIDLKVKKLDIQLHQTIYFNLIRYYNDQDPLWHLKIQTSGRIVQIKYNNFSNSA